MLKSLIAGAMALVLLTVSGCANMEPRQKELITQIATEYAVAKFVKHDLTRAEKVAAIAGAAARLISEDEVTDVAELENTVMGMVDFSGLEPEDRALATGLIRVVRVELESRLSDESILPEERRVQVTMVLGWVQAEALRNARAIREGLL